MQENTKLIDMLPLLKKRCIASICGCLYASDFRGLITHVLIIPLLLLVKLKASFVGGSSGLHCFGSMVIN